VPGTTWVLTESSDIGLYGSVLGEWTYLHTYFKTDVLLVFSKVSHKEESTIPKSL